MIHAIMGEDTKALTSDEECTAFSEIVTVRKLNIPKRNRGTLLIAVS